VRDYREEGDVLGGVLLLVVVEGGEDVALEDGDEGVFS
jgi:hypothetical protein